MTQKEESKSILGARICKTEADISWSLPVRKATLLSVSEADNAVVMIRYLDHWGFVSIDHKSGIHLHGKQNDKYVLLETYLHTWSNVDVEENQEKDILVLVKGETVARFSSSSISSAKSMVEYSTKGESNIVCLTQVPQITVDRGGDASRTLIPTMRFRYKKDQFKDIYDGSERVIVSGLEEYPAALKYEGDNTIKYYNQRGEWKEGEQYEAVDMVSYAGELYCRPVTNHPRKGWTLFRQASPKDGYCEGDIASLRSYCLVQTDNVYLMCGHDGIISLWELPADDKVIVQPIANSHIFISKAVKRFT